MFAFSDSSSMCWPPVLPHPCLTALHKCLRWHENGDGNACSGIGRGWACFLRPQCQLTFAKGLLSKQQPVCPQINRHVRQSAPKRAALSCRVGLLGRGEAGDGRAGEKTASVEGLMAGLGELVDWEPADGLEDASSGSSSWQRESRVRRRVLSCGDHQGQTVGRAVASGCRGGNPQP